MMAEPADHGSSPFPPLDAAAASGGSTLDLLEDFFCTPELTSAIAAFAEAHAHEVLPIAEGEEHPLRYQELYLAYTEMMEAKLEGFLREHDVTLEQLMLAAREGGGSHHTCIDYLLASTEYMAFLQLMLDFGTMGDYEIGDEIE